jgi:hypothetical protein
MVRKKKKRREASPNTAKKSSSDARSSLVRDASEVRELMERAQRLLRGDPEPPVEETQDELAVDDAEMEEGQTLPDPNILVSPKPRPRAADSGDEETLSEDEARADEIALDALPEAFITATMGTMLLSQGRAADAQAIFERVLARRPEDAEAQRGLEKAKEAQRAARTHATPPSSAAMVRAQPAQPSLTVAEGEAKEPDGLLERAHPPWGYDVDELRVLPVDPTTIVAFWEVRAATLRRLADEQAIRGELMLRVVTLVRGEDGSLRRSERFEGPVPRVGDWFVWSVANGASHEVSVGVASRTGFFAIMTAEPVVTPRGAPARARAVVRARIVLPERTRGVARSVPRIAEVIGPSALLGALREARATAALEDARFVHESVSSIEARDMLTREPQADAHWSEPVAHESSTSEEDEREPLFDVDSVRFEWAVGSSFSLMLERLRRMQRAGIAGAAPNSPSSPWSWRG